MTKGQTFAAAIVMALIASVLAMPAKRHAHEIRLIGECNGLYYGGQEESDFPDGCAWIEPIRFDVE